MFEIKNNEKNKSAVILNPERSEWVSRSHVTSAVSVVNDGAKTKRYSAKRDLYGDFAYAQPLKMTEKALSFLRLRGASGAQGISTTASCREAHKRRFTFNSWVLHFANTSLRMMIQTLAFLLTLNISTSWADSCTCSWGGADNKTLTITNCSNGVLSSSACSDQKTANNVVVGTGVTSIGDLAFSGASSLESITIPKGVTSIGSNAFHSASGLTSITIPEGVTSIGSGAFLGASGLTSITIPDSVTSIGSAAFQNASSLTSITLPDSLTSIGDSAFYGATNLTSITIPEGVTSIGSQAFRNASGLTSITIPEGVTSIGGWAFYDASGLTSITIPGSLTEVGTNLFIGINGLTDINCAGTEAECTALRTLLDSKGYLPNGRNFNRVEPVTKCSSYTSSGCNACYAGYALSGNACVENTQQSSQAGGTSTGGDISGDFNPADCYNNGQVPYDNKCWDEYPFAKKRWTPAEAAQWLHDGNDNFVIITFKK